MHSSKKLVFAIILALSGNFLLAQDEEIDSVKIDTAYTPVSNEAPPELDRLDASDSIMYTTHFLPDSIVQRLKQDEDFWYANQYLKPKKKKEEEPNKIKEPFFLKSWFRTLIWAIIIGGFVAVLIWFLISSDVRLFRKKAARLNTAVNDELPEDIFSIDYERELERSISSRNLRLSVRLMYLHVLRLLVDRELIQYKQEKTNSDYLAQLYSTSYYKDFFLITRHFEYVWYGKFELTDAAFDAIRKEYETLKNRLQS